MGNTLGRAWMKDLSPHTNEMRQNLITGQWVIYALSRRKRPRELLMPRHAPEGQPVYDANCPFCPGNEDKLPAILFESKGSDPLWQVRIVTNKYPALTPDGNLKRVNQGIHMAMDGYGHHEVIIESPLHNRHISAMSVQEAELVIECCHRRYTELIHMDRNMVVIIFRNHGRRAGASLSHPHSQVISTGIVPSHIRSREIRASAYYDEWGRCVYCAILEEELRFGRRIVCENESFVSFVPYAAEEPFEMWILPRVHRADFADVTDGEKADLASILLVLLQKLSSKLQDPDYNYVIHSCAKYRSGEPQEHWFLRIRPRLTTKAGFEIGSGMSINTDLPEDDASFLQTDGLPANKGKRDVNGTQTEYR